MIIVSVAMIVRLRIGLIRSLAQISKHGEWNGRPASEWCDPRARSGAAGLHVFPACRSGLRVRDPDDEVRRRRVRDGAQSVGRQSAARCAAVSAQPRTDREGGQHRARRDADGARAGERRREGAVAGEAGARPRLLRHRVSAHLDRRGGLQRGCGVPLSAAQDRAELRAGRASAATGRPARCATGA